jgi:hypothetical protein
MESRSHGRPVAALQQQARPQPPLAPVADQRAIPIVVSCPEQGSLNPDGSPPFDQEVMTALQQLQRDGHVKMAFDRAGTSNASKEDYDAFQAATTLQQSMPDNPMWKKMIKDTKWFETYKGGTKKALIVEAQSAAGASLLVVCINGGPITQVEQEEMSTILTDAKSDAAASGVTLNYTLQTMSYYTFVSKFGANAAAKTEQLAAEKQRQEQAQKLAQEQQLALAQAQAEQAAAGQTELAMQMEQMQREKEMMQHQMEQVQRKAAAEKAELQQQMQRQADAALAAVGTERERAAAEEALARQKAQQEALKQQRQRQQQEATAATTAAAAREGMLIGGAAGPAEAAELERKRGTSDPLDERALSAARLARVEILESRVEEKVAKYCEWLPSDSSVRV